MTLKHLKTKLSSINSLKNYPTRDTNQINMEYRIKEEVNALTGKVRYRVQRKGFLNWQTLVKYNYAGSEPLIFNSRDAAGEYIEELIEDQYWKSNN
jgi:hypothetical protein